jgi:transcriptional regulator with XRE-family HTH domain
MVDRSQPSNRRHVRNSANGRRRGNRLGGWVKATRIGQSMSQRELADRAGLSRSYLCDIEHGRGAQPSLNTLDKLAAALGVSRLELLRAAGVLESEPGEEGSDREHRFAVLFRALSPTGKDAVERFARFVHAEEHRWVQTKLIDQPEANADGGPQPPGPMLFDPTFRDAEVTL